ncbi:hypothetical protein Ancab_012369 [Ancistrocladus abbreviatus]
MPIPAESELGVEVHDSQILNMNRIFCQTSPSDKAAQQLTPRQIWDFIEHIGVRQQTSIEDVVRRIGDMEHWELFRGFASKEDPQAADKEVCTTAVAAGHLIAFKDFLGLARKPFGAVSLVPVSFLI